MQTTTDAPQPTHNLESFATPAVAKVLVGVDDSENARHALRWASDFADGARAELSVMHRWCVPYTLRSSQPGPTAQMLNDKAYSLVARAIADAGADKAVSRSIGSGNPGEALSDASAPDRMIVVGRTGRGRRGLLQCATDFFLGSTARHCMHHAKGPVAIIPQGAVWPASNPRVVVGVDGSDASLRALSWARDAVPGDPHVVAMHTVRPWMTESIVGYDFSLGEKAMAGAKIGLEDWISRVADERADEIEAVVEEGDVRGWLTNPRLKADLIVVGTRGRTGLGRFFLGSVAEYVVRHAPCPVVVLPPTDVADKNDRSRDA